MQNQIPKLPFVNLQSIQDCLTKRFENDSILRLRDLPKPSDFENLPLMAQKIAQAIHANKKIAVVGDYDVDGVVSCVMMHDFFASFGYPLEIIIPNRFNDGYGLSQKIVERLDCDVIITVDNGIGALDAARYCKARGIELLITDHHTPQAILPDALICNPKLCPNLAQQDICGAAVAWYLCAGLKQAMGLDYHLEMLLDLLCLAIISDVMPLVGMNRLLFKKGLAVLANTKRLSLQILKNHYQKYPLNSQSIGFFFAPLLNSAGRMDDAREAFLFLIERNEACAYEYFHKLLSLNEERKSLSHELYCEAKKQVDDMPFILAFDPSWHEGIVGILAARLCQEFAKPSIVLMAKDGHLKGSMRSCGVACLDLLCHANELLDAFGGHAGAAGLSLREENLHAFKKRLLEFDYPLFYREDLLFQSILGYLPFCEINLHLWEMLKAFEPYGEGNPLPQFYVRAQVRSISYFGHHSRVVLSESNLCKKAVLFGEHLPLRLKNQVIACCFSLQWDSYLGAIGLKIEAYWV